MSEFGFSRRALLRLVSGGALTSDAVVTDQGNLPAPDPLRYLDTARRLTVQAYVNTFGPFDFLVDTGANSSVIATELAFQLGLPRGAESRLHSIAGTQTVATTRVARLAVGRRVRSDLVVSVLPREQLRMDGVLGLEWLARASLLLDFRQRRMTVGEALPVPDVRTVIVKSKLLRSGLTLIDALMPLQRLVAFVDSGSTTTVGNLAMLEAAKKNNALIGELRATELRSVTGQVLAGRAGTLSRLTLGGMTLRNIPLVFGPIHTFDYWGFREQPAIVIGVDILQRFDRVSMDFKRNEVRFRVPG